MQNYIIPNWPAPKSIRAVTTTRLQGHSKSPYDHNNLALHVEDHPDHVRMNREQLKVELNLPNEPAWLTQIHSTDVVDLDQDSNRQADAAVTRSPNTVLAIMTADCLPILLCDKQGTEIAAIHAGWRGLAQGIIDKTLEKMHSQPQNLMAWLGPSICQTCFETGNDVKLAFIKQYDLEEDHFFIKKQEDKWLANLPALAKMILGKLGVNKVFESNYCTIENTQLFYSYRRERQTGRMASLIWFD